MGGQETWQIYGFGGELVAEYNLSGTFTGSNVPVATSPTKEYGYRNGQMLVVYDNTETDVNQKFKWLVQDHLGSTRFKVGKTGALTTLRWQDYAPFGEGLQGGQRTTAGYGYPVVGVRKKFTSYERDDETGLDFAQARYYSSSQGRFISPDPIGHVGAHQDDPQSWNLYAYVRGNPLAFTDPTGLEYKLCDINGSCSNHSDKNVNDWRKQDGINFSNGNIFDSDGP